MPKNPSEGLTRVGDLIPELVPTGVLAEEQTQVSKQKPLSATVAREPSKRAAKRIDRVVAVRETREQDKEQRIGYLARPFILCGLPFKKPDKGLTYYRRENGAEILEITASPEHGLPFGMDFEVLIWVSTLAKKAMLKNGGKCPRVLEFSSGADFLRAFDLKPTGPAYRSAQERFLRVFYATFFFGSKHQARVRMFRTHFFDEIDLWFTKDLKTQTLPGDDFRNNRIVLSEKFAADLERFLLPIELDAVIAWADNPTQVYFNMWLGWRCYTTRGNEKISLLGPGSLKEQCGFDGYNGPRAHLDFRGKVKKLLANAKASWPECPVKLVTEDPRRPDYLLIERRASPIRARRSKRLFPGP